MDRVSPEKRSNIMSRIRGRDTSPELLVRKMLHSKGARFRLYRKDIPGHPDIVLPKLRLAILVHGCFWHGHDGCNKGRLPKTRLDYWRPKIAANKVRDARNVADLKNFGWSPIIIWQCQTRDMENLSLHLDKLLEINPQSDVNKSSSPQYRGS